MNTHAPPQTPHPQSARVLPPSRLVIALLAAAAVLVSMLAMPVQARAAAAPGTIVYLKNHDVWIAKGDGSGQRRITSDGSYARPWVSPTQSDAGLVVAARGDKIVQMDQWGKVLRTFDPPALTNTAGHPMDGPIANAAVSPDGSKIAYTYAERSWPVGTSCAWRYATGFTDAKQLVPPTKYGTVPFENPSWVTNTRVLVNGGYLAQMNLYDLSQRRTIYWFDDHLMYEDDTDLSNAEVSRNGRFLAAVRGFGDRQQIIWYRVNGDARTGTPTLPSPLCWSAQSSGLTNPTWAPDGSNFAIEQPDGIEIATDVLGCGDIDMASRGKWSPAPKSYSYQWYRSGKKISGSSAKKSSYKVKSADRGRKLTVKVTAKRSGYSSSAGKKVSKRR